MIYKTKCFITFLIIISTSVCLGQGVKFKLFRTKSCITVDQLDTSYYLMEAGRPDTAYTPQNGITYLPKKGNYIIGFLDGPVIEPPIINVTDTSLFVFRYKEPRLQLYTVNATDTPPVYMLCNDLLNGYAEDRYPNGRIRIRATFLKGYPKDSLVRFYPSGRVNQRITIKPKLVKIQDYDEQGHLSKVTYNERKNFMLSRDYQWTEYYSSGKVKSKESSIKGVVKHEEYDSSGKLKPTRTVKF